MAVTMFRSGGDSGVPPEGGGTSDPANGGTSSAAPGEVPPSAPDDTTDVPRLELKGAPAVVPVQKRRRPPRPPATEQPLFVVSAVLTIFGLLALTFFVTLTMVGAVKHARDQQTAFATLRGTLANGTTPVTQLDENNRLLPLGTPIAVIDIPQLDLREVIFEGTTSGVLMSGPGHRRDTPFPGQAGISVIMGRQAAYGGPFRAIDELRPGQVFRVTTGQGTFVFRIVGVRRAGDAVTPLGAGKARVMLVTAGGTPLVPQGLVYVDADMVGEAQPAGPRPLTTASLPQPEEALQGDPRDYMFILLLAQGLFLAAVAITWARYRWGVWQAWLSGTPVLLMIGIALSHQGAKFLPNLM